MKNIKEFFKLRKNLFIENIMTDSREPLNDSIFFCIEGLTVDGHDYIEDAIENGAVVIVYSHKIDKEIIKNNENIIFIKVRDTLSRLNEFADYFYDYPSHNLKIYAVTGTNGKTTISYVTKYLLNKLNVNCGYIGTLGYGVNETLHDTYFTTPNVNELHKILKEIKDANCKAASIEISSQGLDLRRCDSVDVDVACFTNLTHEHLDYHKNFEGYFNAKARLFENLKKDAVACINIDDEYGKKMIKKCRCKVVTFGIDNEADYKVNNLIMYNDHSEFELVFAGKTFLIHTNLVAKFNISNLLAVIASLIETGYRIGDLIPLLKHIEEIPGRCMHIDVGQDFDVIVDYAHTPDGFNKIIDYAKERISDNGKLLVVFGSRGSGDVDKRFAFGKIVDERCDEIFITTEDNHDENIDLILNDIESNIKDHKAHRVPSRKQAIIEAINLCNKGDVLLILGKGVEQYFKTGDTIESYEGDDNVAKSALKTIMANK